MKPDPRDILVTTIRAWLTGRIETVRGYVDIDEQARNNQSLNSDIYHLNGLLTLQRWLDTYCPEQEKSC